MARCKNVGPGLEYLGSKCHKLNTLDLYLTREGINDDVITSIVRGSSTNLQALFLR